MLKHIAAWLVLIVVIAGISVGLGLYKRSQIEAAIAAAQASPEPIEAVGSVRAREGEWSASTRSIGTVVAMRQLEIRNEIAGSIAKLGFTSGDVVSKGQLLVQFDTRQEEAALSASEADARLAKVTLDRREGLRDSPAFSPQEYDKAREDYAAAQARATNLAVVIEKKRISAPFNARIGITNLQPGAYLDVGTLIATLQGVDADAYVDFSIPQDNAALIRPGTTVTISSPVIPGGSAQAKILAEDASVDRANRTVKFRAVASGLGTVFRPGMFIDVTAVTSAPQKTVLVPLASVRRSPEGQHVFVLEKDGDKTRARQRAVQTGAVVNDEIAINNGLVVGDLIAASGSFKLRDGTLVQAEAPPPADQKISTN
jgi:membrane fusion protein (multidrug efflux system)